MEKRKEGRDDAKKDKEKAEDKAKKDKEEADKNAKKAKEETEAKKKKMEDKKKEEKDLLKEMDEYITKSRMAEADRQKDLSKFMLDNNKDKGLKKSEDDAHDAATKAGVYAKKKPDPPKDLDGLKPKEIK